MLWKVYFWAVAALFVVPLPFKLAGYVSGSDKSPATVKIEEMANLAFFLVGLAGLYAYSYGVMHLLAPAFWKGWVVAAVLLSTIGMIWSPKLRYAVEVMGATRTRVAAAVGFALLGPMLVAVWQVGA